MSLIRQTLQLTIILSATLLLTTASKADEYYIFIEKNGKVDVGEEAGQNEKGDVVAIAPFTPQYKPTPSEIALFEIVVVDLTQDERVDLLKSVKTDTQGMTDDDSDDLVTRARYKKVDLDNLKPKKEEKIDKSIFNSNIITK